jgi:class 3 adenylate cyclase/predicted ATPase
MKFSELVDQAGELLRRRARVTYRALKREFDLDDEALDDLKAELIDAQRVALDEEGKVLVWIGSTPVPGSTFQVSGSKGEDQKQETKNEKLAAGSQLPSGERRQLTVMFCDLVGSTALSARLDPEELRDIIRAYQQTCADVISRHEGHIAQYLGDGLLVYFGYPTAHEDDARRAVRAGLEILAAFREQVPSPLAGEGQGEGATSKKRTLQVRIGIHTGLVVIGDIGASDRTEQLALGETPNIAARIQGLAEPNTVLISTATQRLVDGQFECQPFGSHLVKGIDMPIAAYHVQSERQSAALLAGRTTLTPLVGREQEVGLLFDRWEQAKEGHGQVVLLSGEPGIGKSRLAYTLREHVSSEGSLLYEARCSPYHQHSALYPLIDVLQRTLLLTPQDTDEEKVTKLERVLSLYDKQESLPLFIALLSLPTPAPYPPLNFTPQKQKELTLQALLQLLVAQAERQATASVWEDVHWADPSSLEFLSLLIEQLPTTKLLLVLTFRPEFTPPWKPHSHISQLVLNRLGKKQVEVMIEQAAAGNILSAEVINQLLVKTDGVPLFVEELTKSVIESGVDVGARRAVPLQTIPATLQEALLARLDRLSTARPIAQLGATLGREFSYELLRAVSPASETDLHTALAKLVEAEIFYQRGVGPQTRYFFKHALIQDTAYQSLLKSTRQQYHQQIAQVLVARFPGTVETQPELLAHHYTEAGLIEQAIPYWQLAGQKASQRSANAEAITHLTKGLELLKTLPDGPDRVQQELTLQITLGMPLILTKGHAAPEVEATYTQARELCQQVGETPHLFSALLGLRRFYFWRGELQTARELGEQLLTLAQKLRDSGLLARAHMMQGEVLYYLGEFVQAREHLDQGAALYDPQQHRSQIFLYGSDSGVGCLFLGALALEMLGYPDQALKRGHDALTLAQELAHPFSLAFALYWASLLRQRRGEARATQERAEALVALANEQGFALWEAWGTVLWGWALAEQGQGVEGIVRIRQGLDAWQSAGGEMTRTYFLALLAEAYGKMGQTEEGITVLSEALTMVRKKGERVFEAELYRIKGELLLQQNRQQAKGNREELPIPDARYPRRSRFDTKDLQEAKALLEGVSRTLD